MESHYIIIAMFGVGHFCGWSQFKTHHSLVGVTILFAPVNLHYVHAPIFITIYTICVPSDGVWSASGPKRSHLKKGHDGD